MLLAVKLVLVPCLIVAITIAGARFGPRVAGVLTGLPVVAGPIVLFLALEQGPAFAARSAVATLAGETSLAAFCIVYAAAALRTPWWASTFFGWTAFLASTLVLDALDPPLAGAAALALAAPVVVLALTPRPRGGGGAHHALPAAELGLRMAAGVALVVALTVVARALGPRLAGLLTIFPIATTVLAVFSHRAEGAPFAIRLLRGLAAGLYALSAFFLTLVALLEAWGTTRAFLAASAAALATQGITLALVRRRAGAQSQA